MQTVVVLSSIFLSLGPPSLALNPLLQAMNILFKSEPSATQVFVLPLNFGALKVWDLFHFYSIFLKITLEK
jgi:hypothetical protein